MPIPNSLREIAFKLAAIQGDASQILSDETLDRMAPLIQEFLDNLYQHCGSTIPSELLKSIEEQRSKIQKLENKIDSFDPRPLSTADSKYEAEDREIKTHFFEAAPITTAYRIKRDSIEPGAEITQGIVNLKDTGKFNPYVTVKEEGSNVEKKLFLTFRDLYTNFTNLCIFCIQNKEEDFNRSIIEFAETYQIFGNLGIRNLMENVLEEEIKSITTQYSSLKGFRGGEGGFVIEPKTLTQEEQQAVTFLYQQKLNLAKAMRTQDFEHSINLLSRVKKELLEGLHQNYCIPGFKNAKIMTSLCVLKALNEYPSLQSIEAIEILRDWIKKPQLRVTLNNNNSSSISNSNVQCIDEAHSISGSLSIETLASTLRSLTPSDKELLQGYLLGSCTLGLDSITHLETKAGTEQVKFLRDIASQIFKASNVILSIDSNKGFLEDYLSQDVSNAQAPNAPSNSNASCAAR